MINPTKRKPGRPPATDKRKIRTIKMTDAEWQEIQARAMAAGISAGEYIRQAALKGVGA